MDKTILDIYSQQVLDGFMRAHFRRKNSKIHQAICPICGGHLCTLYRRGKVWRCKKCWDAWDQIQLTGLKPDYIIVDETTTK